MTQSGTDAVRAVLDRYVEGTYKGDVDALKDCFHPKAVMNGYFNDQLLLGSPEPFFNDIGSNPSMAEGGAPYKTEVTAVDVTGNVASATVKETGFAGGMAFTNYFHLILEDGEWKITSKTFTTE